MGEDLLWQEQFLALEALQALVPTGDCYAAALTKLNRTLALDLCWWLRSVKVYTW